jgi:tryptophan synthase beta chain
MPDTIPTDEGDAYLPLGGAASNRNSGVRLGESQSARPHFELLTASYEQLRHDAAFLNELDRELLFVADRPTPLLHARRLSGSLGGAQIYLKREDLAPPGAALQVHIVGQALLAQRLGRRTLVTGTVHGQRGVVMAEVAARMGLGAVVYMDAANIAREPANVFRMWLMGAEVHSVDTARLPRGDIREAALAHWLRSPGQTMLVMGLDWGPQPYPLMAREFSAVIGRESRRQLLAQARRGPSLMVARGARHGDAIGFFQPFLGETRTRLVCVEGGTELSADAPVSAPRRQSDTTAAITGEPVSSLREHTWLKSHGRVQYRSAVTVEQARDTIAMVSRLEGCIPPIETAHALAYACAEASDMKIDEVVVAVVCERADKDILKIGNAMGVPL